MKYVSAALLVAVALAVLDGARFMWPKHEEHPDDWLAVAMLPTMLSIVGFLVLGMAVAVLQ